MIFEVGLGKACEIAHALRGDRSVKKLADRFYRDLKSLFGDGVRLNGHPEERLPNTLFVSFIGYALTDVQRALPDVAVSTGSACHSGTTAISPVLAAMGVKPDDAAATIRFSLGRYTTEDEIDAVLKDLSPLIKISKLS